MSGRTDQTQDDFNESLANNTNLAVKGIVAINCMGGIAGALGDTSLAARYVTLAYDYYDL